jgi:putative solute:sodium symporter small subunit
MPPPLPPKARAYWRKNLLLLSFFLGVWFAVSFLLGIVWAQPLNQIQFFGFPLGFWIAQQGSILVFVLIILAYAVILRWLDRHYEVEE